MRRMKEKKQKLKFIIKLGRKRDGTQMGEEEWKGKGKCKRKKKENKSTMGKWKGTKRAQYSTTS